MGCAGEWARQALLIIAGRPSAVGTAKLSDGTDKYLILQRRGLDGGSLSYANLTRQTGSTVKTRPWISQGFARVCRVVLLTRRPWKSGEFSLRCFFLSRPVDTPVRINRSAMA